MAGGIDWFRWHHGSVTDPKFQLIARKASVGLPVVIALWAFLLEKASAADARGDAGDIDAESLDCLFGLEDGDCSRVLEQMRARGLLDQGAVSSWEKRQPKRERTDDNSTARVQAFRKRDAHATPRNATERQETPRVEKSREEDTQPDGCVSAAKASPTTRGTRLAKDWKLPKAWGEWALSEHLHWTADTVRLIGEQFADHWHSKAGKGATSLDWLAVWRNWCRSDITQRAHPKPRDGPGAVLTVPSRAAEETSRMLAEQAKPRDGPTPEQLAALKTARTIGGTASLRAIL